MSPRLTHRAVPALLMTVALLLGGGQGVRSFTAARALGPLGAAGSDSAYYYYCPPGLVQTGSADSLATGATARSGC